MNYYSPKVLFSKNKDTQRKQVVVNACTVYVSNVTKTFKVFSVPNSPLKLRVLILEGYLTTAKSFGVTHVSTNIFCLYHV